MSNFSLSVDLLRFVGAEVCSLDFKGKKRNCIIIPVNWNDIEVKLDNDGKPRILKPARKRMPTIRTLWRLHTYLI